MKPGCSRIKMMLECSRVKMKLGCSRMKPRCSRNKDEAGV
jgi:hypothetical protein